MFYTHPEVIGGLPTIEYTDELIENPVNPQALTPKSAAGRRRKAAQRSAEFPLMGMAGRPSVVHFHSVTQWTYTGKQMNGVRLVQIHPKAAMPAPGSPTATRCWSRARAASLRATALLWDGIREDTIFVPISFGPGAEDGRGTGHAALRVGQCAAATTATFDNLSGQQAYKCFACRVRKA